MLDGVNFAKDYQKDPYNERIFIEKIIDDKNILATLKKHS
jgi:predicted HD phosphohydrolase